MTMPIELTLSQRSIITTLLRREAIRLRGSSLATSDTDSNELASLAEYIDEPHAKAPAVVTKDRDLRT